MRLCAVRFKLLLEGASSPMLQGFKQLFGISMDAIVKSTKCIYRD